LRQTLPTILLHPKAWFFPGKKNEKMNQGKTKRADITF